MPNTNDLINRINTKYSSMSKGQKMLATYITDNYDKAVFLTAAKMGEIVGVSESTVVRFASGLGYDGYPEFQKKLAEWVKNNYDGFLELFSYIEEEMINFLKVKLFLYEIYFF